MTVSSGERMVERLPSWMGSIRFRLTVLYSVLLFGLGAIVVFGIYTAVSRSIDKAPVSKQEPALVAIRTEDGVQIVQGEAEVIELADFEKRVNARTLDNLRKYSFSALGLLFIGSLGVGWFVAGLVLRPIGRITSVARDIQATDLSRRINLRGPNDELRRLAETFDEMLGRLDDAFAGQRRFIQEASHELRNPLAVIRTNLDVVLTDPDATDADLRQTGEVVGRSVERMSTLVDDLLLYARDEAPAGRSELVDVGALVVEVVAEFQATAAARDVALEVAAPMGLWVLGDPVGLRQALANLLANAVRIVDVSTTVRVAAGAEDGWVWMAVEDRGPGIAAEHREKVFQRFWRGDRRLAREEGRSGLGLTIVRQIAEAHRGQVELLSEVGIGSTFVVWLPAADPTALLPPSST